MSMIIGKFTQNGTSYTGSIATAGLYIPDVNFTPVPAKRGDGPDFVVLGNTRAENFELGAAWAKTSKKGQTISLGQDRRSRLRRAHQLRFDETGLVVIFVPKVPI
jgi:uncharacterized protein (DUF736 family)